MNERQVRWESYHIPDRFENTNKSEREDLLADLEDSDDEEDSLVAEEIRNAPTLMETPFGLIERDDSLNPFRQLEFWMLHTNFNVTGKVFVITNFLDGVEAVKAVSRYRLLVGFGKLFNASEVKKQLEEKLVNISDYPDDLYKRQRRMLINQGEM